MVVRGEEMEECPEDSSIDDLRCATPCTHCLRVSVDILRWAMYDARGCRWPSQGVRCQRVLPWRADATSVDDTVLT
eukprot:652376-Rhodomonas_salina.8